MPCFDGEAVYCILLQYRFLLDVYILIIKIAKYTMDVPPRSSEHRNFFLNYYNYTFLLTLNICFSSKSLNFDPLKPFNYTSIYLCISTIIHLSCRKQTQIIKLKGHAN